MIGCGVTTNLLALLLLFAIPASNSVSADALHDGATVRQSYAAAHDAAAELVAHLTLDEKLGQITSATRAIPRLGIPPYHWWSEALHGAVSDFPTTNFPVPIGLAASFDEQMIFEVARAISAEQRGLNAVKRQAGELQLSGTGLDVWAPNINIFRDPRWGRGQETYGEDPFLTGRMAVGYIRGIQGPDPDHPEVIATPKHFAVHSGPESTRHQADVTVSAHDLEDTYLPAFRAAIVDAKAGSIMCAYNSVNGSPACMNDFLLGRKLRHDWRFKGYVVSDCMAISDIVVGHKAVSDGAHAVAAAVKAGMDNECTVDDAIMLEIGETRARYRQALAEGLLREADIDQALIRLFTARYRLGEIGTIGRPLPTASDIDQIGSKEHRALALESAEKSIVLLKNDGVLPLRQGKLRIAVIGPLADAERVLRGSYSSGITSGSVTAIDGLRAAFPDATIDLVPSGFSYGEADVVPKSALRTPDGAPGLLARYYPALPLAEGPVPPTLQALFVQTQTMRFAPEPAATRNESVDRVILTAGDPTLPKLSRVSWTGFLVPPESGLYRLGLKGQTSQLSLDGKPFALLDGFFPNSVGELKEVMLEKGHPYPIAIDAVKLGSVLDIRLVWKRISAMPQADARAAAKNADVVLAVVGINSDIESEEIPADIPGFLGGDRTNLELPDNQLKLLEAAKSAGKPLIVAMMSGSALNLAWVKENASAILQCWYPGEEGGAAIARVLSGAVNPAGRLPVTFYHDVSQLPSFDNYGMAGRTYRYFEGTPVYPFGFGLSYTAFSYGPVTVTSPKSAAKGVTVKTVLENTGTRAGDEVAQLYLQFPHSPGVPRIALRGFQRTRLEPGERRPLTFHLSPRDLSSVSQAGVRRVAPGRYQVSVGGGQPGPDVPASLADFFIERGIAVPK